MHSTGFSFYLYYTIKLLSVTYVKSIKEQGDDDDYDKYCL